MIVIRDVVEFPRERIGAEKTRIAVIRSNQNSGRAEDSVRGQRTDNFDVGLDVCRGRGLPTGEPLVIDGQRHALGDPPGDDRRENRCALFAGLDVLEAVLERAVETEEQLLAASGWLRSIDVRQNSWVPICPFTIVKGRAPGRLVI